MRAEVIAWAVLALLLIAAETLAPGAFLLWMGLAAAAVFLGVLLVPGIPVLAQAAAFVVLSFVAIQVYRKWFRKAARQSDQPLLNRRAAQAIGRVTVLEQAIARSDDERQAFSPMLSILSAQHETQYSRLFRS